MANSYIKGTLVQMTATFQVSGVNTDPGSVTFEFKDPSTAITTPTPTKDAVGQYHVDFITTLVGVHYYRFLGTNGVTVAGESSFVVTPSNF